MELNLVRYTDDLLIIMRGPHINILKDISQRALDAVECWCCDTGLSINPEKVELMIFTRNYEYDGTCAVASLDKMLRWNIHLEGKCETFRKGLWQQQPLAPTGISSHGSSSGCLMQFNSPGWRMQHQSGSVDCRNG